MEYNKSINAMTPGDEVEGYYILKSANPKVAANGKPFLTGALSDRTGTMELKVWDYAGPLTAADEGTVVKVRGTVGEYRGTPQFTAGRIRPAAQEDPVDVSALVPTAPIDCGAAMEDLRRAAASITDPDYRAMAEAMLEAHGETLASIPAAKSVHHAFLGGLLGDIATLIVLLAGQTLFMILYVVLVVFNIMGRDYDAAVIVSGTCGFGMGATPNAMANMQAICDKYSPSVKAYLLIPLVGSLFADFLNSLVITVFINFI